MVALFSKLREKQVQQKIDRRQLPLVPDLHAGEEFLNGGIVGDKRIVQCHAHECRRSFPEDFARGVFGDENCAPAFEPECFRGAVVRTPAKLRLAGIFRQDEHVRAGFIASTVFLGRAQAATNIQVGFGGFGFGGFGTRECFGDSGNRDRLKKFLIVHG